MAIEALEGVMRDWWGFDRFLPAQREAMTAVLARQDSVVVLPTGGGKSLCYQAPALCMDGMAVVVSPLIALMTDQVDQLRQLGVPAHAINSMLDAEMRRTVDADVRGGATKILYVTPERLVSDRFLDYLARVGVSFFAIDEAHCISQWGHDFRPEYRQLGVLREAFPEAGVHAFTATATPEVRADIAAQLGLRDPAFHTGPFHRANLTYRARRRENLLAQVEETLARHAGASGIIYCIRRADVDDLCAELNARGHRALPYHAGLDDATRNANQRAFIREDADLIVATVAFGMGIDKPNVRFVLHAAMPKSLEHYQQESGRAGRDGLPSECLLLYSGGDFGLWRRLVEKDADDQSAEIARKKLGDMYDYCARPACRHRGLLEYFGEPLAPGPCGACDFCLDEIETVDGADDLAKTILAGVEDLDGRFGAVYLAKFLAGGKDERMQKFRHDKRPRYGAMQAHGQSAVRDWIEQLCGQGWLARVGEYNVVELTRDGRDFLEGKDSTTPILTPPTARGRAARPSRAKPGADHPAVDKPLFEALRALRREIAEEERVAPYMVFGDVTLNALAAVRPSDEAAFAAIHGVGARKLRAYANRFIAAIREHCEIHGLSMNQDPDDGLFKRAPEAPAAKAPKTRRKQQILDEAAAMFQRGANIDEVAERLNRAPSTVLEYLRDCVADGRIEDISPWVDADNEARIRAAADEHGYLRLKPIHEALGGAVDYDQIRVVLARIRRETELAE